MCVCLGLVADTLKQMSHLTRDKRVYTTYISTIDLQLKHKTSPFKAHELKENEGKTNNKNQGI